MFNLFDSFDFMLDILEQCMGFRCVLFYFIVQIFIAGDVEIEQYKIGVVLDITHFFLFFFFFFYVIYIYIVIYIEINNNIEIDIDIDIEIEINLDKNQNEYYYSYDFIVNMLYYYIVLMLY